MGVYFIDPDDAIRDAASLVFAGLDHQAFCYPDGEAFFNEASPTVGDVVFVELLLPRLIRGATVINWLRSMKRAPHIVAMSGAPMSSIQLELRGLKGGTIHVLRKPLSRSEIRDQLSRAPNIVPEQDGPSLWLPPRRQ